MSDEELDALAGCGGSRCERVGGGDEGETAEPHSDWPAEFCATLDASPAGEREEEAPAAATGPAAFVPAGFLPAV